MSNIVDFSKYKENKLSNKSPAKTEKQNPSTRCEQVNRLVVGKYVTEVICIDEENFALIFENGAKLSLTISIENDLGAILSIIESSNDS